MRFIFGTLLALAFAQLASAYTYVYDVDGTAYTGTHQPIKWTRTPVVMHVEVGSNPTTSDTNRNQAVMSAISIWNANIAAGMTGTIDSATTGHNTTNEMFFDTTVYGTAFGASTLAVTTTWSYSDNQRSEADIVFNNNPTITVSFNGTPQTTTLIWDSYRGVQKFTASPYTVTIDIRRIALHELGHALGLGHPDQATDGSVEVLSPLPIMHSSSSDTDNLTPDDTTGAQHLYGIPGGAAPANDNFSNATLIGESDGRLYTGSNIYTNAATRETGEPATLGYPIGHSVWWKWVAPNTNTATVDTRGSYFDTIMGVYTGSSVNALTTITEDDDEAGNTSHTSLVSFNPVAGTTYYIKVDGYYYNDGSGAPYNIFGDVGDIKLHLNQTVSNVAPTISNPASTTVNVGVAAQFSVSANGVPAPTLQWFRQPSGNVGFVSLSASSTYVGVTSSTLTINNTVTGMTGDQFKCVATNSSGTATSNPATLTVVLPIPPIITVQPSNSTVSENSNAIFTMAASSATPIVYLWQVSTNGGSTYNNLSEVAPYSGTTTPTLSLTLVSSLLSGNYYRCAATNVTGTTYTSGALLTVNRPPAAITLSAGRYHSLRLDNSSQLLATGTNTYGQLGTASPSITTTPIAITLPGSPVVGGVAAGAQHSLFLTTGRQLFAVGNNDNGQLGDNSITTRTTPFVAASNVAEIAANRLHSAFVTTDGTLWTVGGNDEGQLGDGTTTERHVAVSPAGATNVVDLATGIRQTLFIKTDGTLWGTGDFDATGPTTTTPIQIATGVQAVAAGAYHTLFLKTDGTCWTFGYNPYGQLGDGSTTTRLTPVQIATNVKSIAAGYFHSAFIKTDNTLWVFGFNSFGQLGDGTATNRPTPFQLATNVTSVSASESYTLFTKTDGSLWATGLNGNGQFGNFSLNTVSTPVRVVGGILAAPAAPSGLAVAANTAQDRLNLTWSRGGDAAVYEVWRNTTNSFGSATRIAQNVRWGFYQDLTASAYTTYYYWIVAVNPAGSSGASVVASGSFGPLIAPGFSTQPSPQSLTAGGTATFTVVATGFPAPTLQWQRQPSGGGGFSNLSNGGSYSGVTTATLSVSSTTTGMNGDQFRCVATNSVTSTNSNAVTLTVTSGVPAVPGDMNGDHLADILWENTTTGDRGFWLMSGTNFASWVDIGIISPALQIVGTADFNQDGQTDIVWENTSTGKRVIWFMNGTTFVSSFSLGIVSTDWHIAAVADFNHDGHPDILWENTVTGDRGFWLMNGTTFVSWVDIGTITTDWRIAGAGDFNGDGKPDILWQNTTSGELGFWMMNDTTFASWVDVGAMTTDWRIAGVGDYNNDTKPDIIWENTSSGLRYIWLMDGTVITSAVALGTVTTDWRIAN